LALTQLNRRTGGHRIKILQIIQQIPVCLNLIANPIHKRAEISLPSIDPVMYPTPILSTEHQSGCDEDAHVLGCGGTGYPEPLMDLAGTKLFALQQSRDYPKTVAVGQGFKEMIQRNHI